MPNGLLQKVVMSHRALASTSLAELRRQAADRLEMANAGSAASAISASSALAVLHGLASSPSTAVDALALLHELQVYQVELELQAEQLRDSRAETEADLNRQMQLYDFQPVSCFTVDSQLTLLEANRAAQRMLGLEAGHARGLRLREFATAACLDRLQALLAKCSHDKPATARLVWRTVSGTEWDVRADVVPDPSGGAFFVVLTNVGHEPGTPVTSES